MTSCSCADPCLYHRYCATHACPCHAMKQICLCRCYLNLTVKTMRIVRKSFIQNQPAFMIFAAFLILVPGLVLVTFTIPILVATLVFITTILVFIAANLVFVATFLVFIATILFLIAATILIFIATILVFVATRTTGRMLVLIAMSILVLVSRWWWGRFVSAATAATRLILITMSATAGRMPIPLREKV